MSGHVLVSGATGLLGRYLVRDLLLAGHRLAIILRPTQKDACRERSEQILQLWENQGEPLFPRPVCLEGDVSKPALGLAEADQRWVAEHCDAFIHNAASLCFFGPDRQGEPWRTNADGTQNVLEFCRRLNISDLHYVSTAYVCGLREGIVREDELEAGQRFRNDYEHSKFLAEQLVRKAAAAMRVTIYRPVVLLGDSLTGYTASYHGAYLYLRLMSVILRQEKPGPDGRIHAPVRLDLTGEELRNVVPVDWASRVMVQLFGTLEAHGRTFHLASDRRLVTREFVEHGLSCFNAYGVVFQPAPEPYNDRISRIDALAHENMGIYADYQQTDPVFDTSNLKRYAGHIACPAVDREMVARFVRYGEADNWGKRRPPRLQIRAWAEDLLRRSLGEPGELRVAGDGWRVAGGPRPSSPTSRHAPPATRHDSPGTRTPFDLLGLDLLGPGGGQWCFVFHAGRLLGYDRGLPEQCGTVIRLPAAKWIAWLEQGGARGGDWLQDGVAAGDAASAQRLLRALAGHLASPTTPNRFCRD